MYHIDLSYLNGNSVCPSEKKTIERDYNNLFESQIINKINQHGCNSSSCFYCFCNGDKDVAVDKRTIIEVECHGLLNCSFSEVKSDLQLYPDDLIIVQYEDSHEVATVKLVGEIVRIKRHSLGFFGEELPVVIRKVTADDIEKLHKNLGDEERAIPHFRKAIIKFNLTMKLVSVHYQFDRKKLFFFYTADGRVDFRELAKDLAAEFKTRIELRQIGVRDEAKKIGGVGTCGREYCCISFLSSFKKITTQLANEQNLLSSMGKLSGPCGKLKCCLSFESE